MSSTTPSIQSLKLQIAAHRSWANTADRTARTAPARQALENRFLTDAGGDPVLAETLRKIFYKELALKSMEARRRRSGGASPPTPTGDSSTGGSTSAESLVRAAHTALNNAGIGMSASKVSRLVRQFQHRVEANGLPFEEFLCNAVVMDAEQRRRVLADPEIARVTKHPDPVGEEAVNNVMRENTA